MLFEVFGFNLKNLFFFFRNGLVRRDDEFMTSQLLINFGSFSDFNELFVIHKSTIFILNPVSGNTLSDGIIENSKIFIDTTDKANSNVNTEFSEVWVFDKISNYFVK
jgi:hypothetical protein